MVSAEADNDAQSLTSEGICRSRRDKHLTEKGAEFHAQMLHELVGNYQALYLWYRLKGSFVKFATILRAFIAKIAYRI